MLSNVALIFSARSYFVFVVVVENIQDLRSISKYVLVKLTSLNLLYLFLADSYLSHLFSDTRFFF